MGPKGANVQGITQDFDVSIKFPDREKPSSQSTVPNGDGGASPDTSAEAPPPTTDSESPAVNGDDGEGEGEAAPVVNPRHVILITGRQENAEAAKQALMVSLFDFVFVLLPGVRCYGTCMYVYRRVSRLYVSTLCVCVWGGGGYQLPNLHVILYVIMCGGGHM